MSTEIKHPATALTVPGPNPSPQSLRINQMIDRISNSSNKVQVTPLLNDQESIQSGVPA